MLLQVRWTRVTVQKGQFGMVNINPGRKGASTCTVCYNITNDVTESCVEDLPLGWSPACEGGTCEGNPHDCYMSRPAHFQTNPQCHIVARWWCCRDCNSIMAAVIVECYICMYTLRKRIHLVIRRPCCGTASMGSFICSGCKTHS